MTLDKIDNIEFEYIQIHYLLDILEKIVQHEQMPQNICTLINIILEKRNTFYNEFESFLAEIIRTI